MGTIGERIKKARNDKGITQEELAEQLDITFQSVSKWENDKSQPDVNAILKLSEVLSVSLDYLMRGEEVPSSENKDPLRCKVDDLLQGYLKVSDEWWIEFRNHTKGFTDDHLMDCFRSGYGTYVERCVDSEKKKGCEELLKNIRGIIHNRNCPPVDREITYILNSYKKRCGDSLTVADEKTFRENLKWMSEHAEQNGKDPIPLLKDVNNVCFRNARNPGSVRRNLLKIRERLEERERQDSIVENMPKDIVPLLKEFEEAANKRNYPICRECAYGIVEKMVLGLLKKVLNDGNSSKLGIGLNGLVKSQECIDILVGYLGMPTYLDILKIGICCSENEGVRYFNDLEYYKFRRLVEKLNEVIERVP